MPRPPCGVAPLPAHGAAGGKPAIVVRAAADLRQAGWQPPACLAWSGDSRLIVALAGELRSGLSMDQLLMRLGAISAYPTIKYWSVGRQQWRPLALEAAVTDGPAGRETRPDLAPEEFIAGRDHYYFERGAETGRSVHRLRLRERSPDRAVVSIDNQSPIRVNGFTAFEPGALQSVIFLERRGLGLWSFYEITRAGEASSSLVARREGSFVSRLIAFYRYMAGMPTDLEPPSLQ
ncbi:MAG TPA: DUF6675 family protein [Reyranellaceae bacterium]|nr:DUF6675 family protein [Reyranellaceae bacterium]